MGETSWIERQWNYFLYLVRKQLLLWRYPIRIAVQWPRGLIKVSPSHKLGWNGIGDYFEYVESADPNDHYRPWLEANVGRQGRDWNWGVLAEVDKLEIMFKQQHKKTAIFLALKWA